MRAVGWTPQQRAYQFSPTVAARRSPDGPVAAAYRAGSSVAQIARQFGLSPTTIWTDLTAAWVPRRPPGLSHRVTTKVNPDRGE